jgi:uroporphyrinogen-III decarboxylase
VDIDIELDEDALEHARYLYNAYGEDALIAVEVGESPLMMLVEYLAGVENAHFLLADFQAEIEELFDAMHRVLLKKCEILARYHPADVFYMIENTSTTLISPQQYRTYCAHHISDYAAIAKQYGRDMNLHMCGHLKKLLPDLAKLQVQGFEAFTAPTLGNTTLLDGRTACPDKCLIGGTHAMLWTESVEDIIQHIETSLAALPHHRGIAVTSAGEMPPMCKPETLKEVCTWVHNYPAKY